MFNLLKQQNEDIATKVYLYLIEKDNEKKIFNDNINQEAIQHAISRLEEEKNKKQKAFDYCYGSYSNENDDTNDQYLENFLCFSFLVKYSAKELNQFASNGLNPFSSFKNFTEFPFLSSISYSIIFTKLLLNSLSLSLFGIKNMLKIMANKVEKIRVSQHIKLIRGE